MASCGGDGGGDDPGGTSDTPGETCGNAKDDDGDGSADEGCPCTVGETRSCYGGPSGTDGVPPCRAGEQTCGGDGAWGECTGEIPPATEVCNGQDDDCNGEPDEGCECVVGTTESCYPGPGGTEGVGACKAGARSCEAADGGSGSAWSLCEGWVGPADEACDSIDNDCDGVVDDGIGDADGDGYASVECGGPDCDDSAKSVHPDAQDSTLQVETIASGAAGYSGVGLRVGPDDVLHASFFADKTPMYAHNGNGSFAIASVGPSSHGAFHTDLVLDAQGSVHVAFTYTSYPNPDVEDLYYTTNATGAWEWAVLDASGDTGYGVSLGIDPTGQIHASYYCVDCNSVRYATKEKDTWVAEDIEKPGSGMTSIAVDASGNPFVAYSNHGLGVLELAHEVGDGWAKEVVDGDPSPGGMAGRNPSLALDDDGAAHISYTDGDSGTLRYATNAKADWALETVPGATAVDGTTAIARSGAGDVYIGFCDGEQRPSLAARVGGVWAVSPVEPPTAKCGFGRSLRIDSQGRIHMVYSIVEAGGAALRHLTIDAPDNVDANCDGLTF